MNGWTTGGTDGLNVKCTDGRMNEWTDKRMKGPMMNNFYYNAFTSFCLLSTVEETRNELRSHFYGLHSEKKNPLCLCLLSVFVQRPFSLFQSPESRVQTT